MKILPKIRRIPKKYLIILIIIILAVSYFFYFKKPKVEPLEYAAVVRQDIKSTVSASGTLTGKDTADMKFKTGGKLAYLNVKAGDTVKKGQVIAGLDTQQLNIQLQQSQNDLRSKQATAEKAEDDVKDHAKDESFAQKQQRTAAQSARDSAVDSVKEAQRAFQDAVLVAPISGIVTQSSLTAGQNVSPSDLVAEIVDQSGIYFDAEIDESDIGKITIGQPVDVSLNSYENKTFPGIVDQIMPVTKTTSSGATVIVTKINLQNSQINFVNGLNGQAAIILEQSKNTLVIPIDALMENNTVAVKNGDSYKMVSVTTGLRSDTDVEIKSGLNEGDQVVTNPASLPKK